ncbi:TlpA disulfide reductase family protein [Chromatiaceae bacterium AAb-1]|nr:TlpA disulfide reductase family protein [Chromatiaceae bacterium AAb-1]
MKYLYLLLSLLLLPQATAQTTVMQHSGIDFSQPLRELHTNAAVQLSAGKPYLLTFYAPDCRFCERQLQHMQQLAASCPDAGMAVLGINGNRRELRAVLKQYRITLPAYFPDTRLLRQLGGIAATPYTVVLDAQLQAVGSIQGYLSDTRLLAILQELGAC